MKFDKSPIRQHLFSAFIVSLVGVLFLLAKPSKAAIVFDKFHSPYSIDSTLTIAAGDTLILLEGTTLVIDTSVDIVVYGTMFIRGTAANPVRLLPKTDSLGWGQIKLLNKGAHCKFEHAEIVDGTVIAIAVNLVYQHIRFVNRQQLSSMHNITRVAWGSADFENCSIESMGKGEGFNLKNMNHAVIRNCIFRKIPDAIELTQVKNSRISNCFFIDVWDDAIDLNNCTDIVIDSNTIVHAIDRGIEVGSEGFGSSRNITIRRNLIIDCKEGVAFKEGSTGLLLNNTLYKNKTAVVCKELIEGSGGSTVLIENSILSQSKVNTFETDSLSKITINYSLSDKEMLDGRGNLFSDPQFVDAKNRDFRLRKTSPAIHAGNPFQAINPDGTNSDMGAFFYSPDSTIHKLSPETSIQFFSARPSASMTSLTLNYHLPKPAEVVITLYNSKGEKVKILLSQVQLAGYYSLPFFQALQKGIYFCSIAINKQVKSFKLAIAN